MLNHIVIMGRLVADPDLRTTPNGVTVATLRLAVDRDFKNKQTGERETDFINVVAWRQTAEFVSRFFSKGRMAVVEGRLQIRQFTDKEGNKRSVAEVVAENIYFGDSRPANSNYGAAPQHTSPSSAYGMPAAGGYGAAPTTAAGNFTPPVAAGGFAVPPATGSYGASDNGNYGANAPVSESYTPPGGGDQFSELTEDDELPF